MSLSTLLDENNKQKRDYTCLLSDSPNIKWDLGRKSHPKCKIKRGKNAEKMIESIIVHSQTEAKKKHKKPLKQDGLTWHSTGKSP